VELIPTGLEFADPENEKKSVAEAFRSFIKDHPDFIVMKGNLDTASVLRGALSIYKNGSDSGNGGLPSTGKMASFTGIFVLPDNRFVALSDPAVNPGFRDSATLVKAIENLVDVVRKIVGPLQTLKIAIVTAIEKKTSAIPATLLAAKARTRSEMLQDRYGPLVVEGPISLDLAMIPDVAEEKGYSGRVMGDANCLVASDINTANVLYKMFSKILVGYGLFVDYGGIVTAGPGTSPISLTSRADSARIRFNSIMLALAYSAPNIK
jgi:phosphate butyryltransferase